MSHDAAEHGIQVTGDIDWDEPVPVPSTPVHDPLDDIPECGDIGPEYVVPGELRCHRPRGHEGPHRGDPTKGKAWENAEWWGNNLPPGNP